MVLFCDTDKTLFTYTNEDGGTSTLTLDKSVADALPSSVGGDVHAWIQTQYDDIRLGHKRFEKYIYVQGKQGENLSRRSIGDIIRMAAFLAVANNVVSDW